MKKCEAMEIGGDGKVNMGNGEGEGCPKENLVEKYGENEINSEILKGV